MRNEEGLYSLAREAGILLRWEEADGVERSADAKTLRRILAARGLPAEDPEQIEDSRRRLEARRERPVPPVWVMRGAEEDRRVPLRGEARECGAAWSLLSEQGESWEGRTGPGGPVRLPRELGLGYHRLHIEAAGQQAVARLISAPGSCWRPSWMDRGDRLTAVTAPMYALRSEEDAGIGDLGALRTLAAITAGIGGDAVAVSPLHALFPADPGRASPYAPSSRRWLDPRYIDLRAAAARLGMPDPQPPPSASPDRVDPEAVWEAKEGVLRGMYLRLRDGGWEGVQRLRETFQAFLAEGGEDLRDFCRFHVLHGGHGGRPWWEWTPAGSVPTVPEPEEEGRFQAFLQWLTAVQYREAARSGRDRMRLGFVGDLAVGTPPDSFDVWSQQDLHALEAEIGAPPDPFSPRGQAWGLTPWDPHRLREQGMEPWARLLRAAMSDMGALRIDHAMGLRRLYWIPRGQAPERGAYVRCPERELFAVLALESHRSRCLVVAEDLGTVPEGFRECLRHEGILSTRLVYFEREEEGGFEPPAAYPREALTAAGSHDLPTLRGWLTGRDIAQRRKRGLLDEAEEGREQVLRSQARELLLRRLQEEGLLPEDFDEQGKKAAAEVVRAVCRYLGRTPSALCLLSLEDLMLMRDQLNLPGTHGSYPNWRLRIPRPVESLQRDPFFHDCVKAAIEERMVQEQGKGREQEQDQDQGEAS
ncbi:MAG: 4-alpha-glucanotransferase [bacterium]